MAGSHAAKNTSVMTSTLANTNCSPIAGTSVVDNASPMAECQDAATSSAEMDKSCVTNSSTALLSGPAILLLLTFLLWPAICLSPTAMI